MTTVTMRSLETRQIMPIGTEGAIKETQAQTKVSAHFLRCSSAPGAGESIRPLDNSDWQAANGGH